MEWYDKYRAPDTSDTGEKSPVTNRYTNNPNYSPEALGQPATGRMASAPSGAEDIPWYDKYKVSTHGWQERLAAATEAGTGGAIEATGTVGGAIQGAKLGAKRGPWMAVAGAVTGGITGALAAGQARDIADIRRPEDFPEGLRPDAYAGEVIGSGIPFAVLPYGPWRFADTSIIGRWANNVMATAKAKPVASAGVEASGIGGSAVLSGAAERSAPGNTPARIGAEMVAPVFVQSMIQLGRLGLRQAGTTLKSMRPEGRRTAAGKHLVRRAEDVGDNISAIMRAYEEFPNMFPGIDREQFSLAQITGSRFLAAVEKDLARHSESFGQEVRRRFEDGMETIRAQIVLFTGTGDPAAVKEAARIRTEYMRELLDAQLQVAEETAVTAVRNITSDSQTARAAISKPGKDAIEKVVRDSRVVEKELWENVPKELEAGVDNLGRAIREIQDSVLDSQKGEVIPKHVLAEFRRITKQADVDEFGAGFREFIDDVVNVPVDTTSARTTIDQLKKMRTVIIDELETPDLSRNRTRILSILNDAILEDMDVVFKELGDDSYDIARNFTREFHDVFTRSFTGKALSETKRGDRVAPELLMREAMASGGEAAELKLRELDEAVSFLIGRENVPARYATDTTALDMMLDSQRRIIRLTAAKLADPLTGKINPKTLQKFIRDEPLLNKFPEIKADLQRAVTSEKARRLIETDVTRQVDFLKNSSDLALIIKQNPVQRAKIALRSTDVATDGTNNELVSYIRTSREAATTSAQKIENASQRAAEEQRIMKGVTYSIYQAIMDASMTNVTGGGQTNRVLDLGKFTSNLFNATSVGRKSVIDTMFDQGLVTAEEVKGMGGLLQLAQNVLITTNPGMAIDTATDLGDVLIDAGSRFAGTFIMKSTLKQWGVRNIPITAYTVGANVGEQVLRSLPRKTMKAATMEIMLNPGAEIINPITGTKTTVLKLMYSNARSPEEMALKIRQMNAWFIRAGVYNFVDKLEQEIMPEEGVTQ